MKHFLLEGQHLVPFEELGHLVDDHHAFLQRGYDDGHFLFSGPHVPAHGGFLVARAASREALDALLARGVTGKIVLVTTGRPPAAR